jgi:hypothetical protein
VVRNLAKKIACAAQKAGVGFVKGDNRFTRVDDPAGLAQIPDNLVPNWG